MKIFVSDKERTKIKINMVWINEVFKRTRNENISSKCKEEGRLEIKCMNYMMENMKDYNINEQIIQNIAQLRKLVLNSDPTNERTWDNNYDKIENFPIYI